ncbi:MULTISPECIES: dephospho-CoA kinase [Eubacterium]|uniref:Dephospho-CoA kinase n=1 Tax=Eubacterium barkeri TaxID=1528 RepID=A0A1H3DYD9_EUBBA|nr:dephospho-CoA kinase [Eubacterium barkeri]SDX71360.1 dephospho-CoA kinase [Eubacterium barkeri]
MKVIGLTGGIASGKSTVSRILREEFGIPIVDADQISRDVVAPGGAALERIAEAFGSEYLLPGGGLDRKRMGALICEDTKAKNRLEGILHPIIEHHVENIIADYRARGTDLIVYDCPLLLEARQERFVDSVALVVTDIALRVRRLMERDGITEDEARKKIAIQMSDGDKQRYADFLISNDGDEEALREALSRLVMRWKNC